MKVEIWSDVMCPWCYIGKRRFERALEQFPQAGELEIEWKSFQLNPELKTDASLPVREYLARKYGVDSEQAEQMNRRVSQVAAGVGLAYQLDQVVLSNTFNAHRLLHFAKTVGQQNELKERLLRAYFIEGKNVDDLSVLTGLAKEVGLDEREVGKVLESDLYAEAVKADIREGQQLGVQGVPFFVFGRKYGISGAQETNVFAQTLKKSFAEWREAHPSNSVTKT